MEFSLHAIVIGLSVLLWTVLLDGKFRKVMSSVHRAKEFLEEAMLAGGSASNGARTFVNESFEKAIYSNGFSGLGSCDSDNGLVGVGLLKSGRLEVALDMDYILCDDICDHFGLNLCRKIGLHQSYVRVVRSSVPQVLRKIQAGSKVGHYNLAVNRSYGTLGSFILDLKGDAEHHIISNNHVLADTNTGNVGDPIYLVEDNCPEIGMLKAFVPIYSDIANELDLALATFDGEIRGSYSSKRGFRKAEIGETVVKTGATTGTTYGKIRSLNYTHKVDLGGEVVVFKDQLLITPFYQGVPFSQPGDSGSGIYSHSDGAFLGLLFAGNDETTNANHGTKVVAQLRKWGLAVG